MSEDAESVLPYKDAMQERVGCSLASRSALLVLLTQIIRPSKRIQSWTIMKLSILLSSAVVILEAVSTSARLGHYHYDSAVSTSRPPFLNPYLTNRSQINSADYDADYGVEDFGDILRDEEPIFVLGCRHDTECEAGYQCWRGICTSGSGSGSGSSGSGCNARNRPNCIGSSSRHRPVCCGNSWSNCGELCPAIEESGEFLMEN